MPKCSRLGCVGWTSDEGWPPLCDPHRREMAERLSVARATVVTPQPRKQRRRKAGAPIRQIGGRK